MFTIVASTIAIVLSIFALLTALYKGSGEGRLTRAFNELEADFEGLREQVLSSLGRVSRLKRSMMEVNRAEEGGAPGSQVLPPPSSIEARRQQLNQQILNRRAGIMQPPKEGA